MLSSLLLLLPLLLSNQIPELSCQSTAPPCSWEYQWSVVEVPDALNPPTNTSCHLYFSDQLSFANADTMDHMLYRVDTRTELENCNISAPIHGVSVAAGNTFSVTLNAGDFALTALDDVFMISEPISGSCFQLAFFINVDKNRDCDEEKDGGVCDYTPPTPTPPPTTDSSPTPSSGTQTGSVLSGVEIFLVIACCLLFVAVVVAIVVLVFLFVYLPIQPSCVPAGFLRVREERGTELKPNTPPTWRQKKTAN